MRRATTAALALLALAAAACGGADTGPPPGAATRQPPTATSPSTTGPTEAGTQAGPSTPSGTAVPASLDFTAPGVDGGQVLGADYAGGAVALWFWAPW